MVKFLCALLLCIFGLSNGSELRGIGTHPRTSVNDYKKTHPSLKIINGTVTSVNKYPFVASVEIFQNEFGAAAIVGKQYLLTTAFLVSWVDPIDLQFRVGSNSYNNGGQVLKASQIFVHPNYTGSWDYNIAVVLTDTTIRMKKKKVQPIQLGDTSLTGGVAAQLIGWGMSGTAYSPSDVLLEGQVTVLDWTKCSTYYQQNLTANLMCTQDKNLAPCVFDFGDPLVVKQGKKPYLYGLYAGSWGCQSGAYPAVYTNIPPLKSWIDSIITSFEDSND